MKSAQELVEQFTAYQLDEKIMETVDEIMGPEKDKVSLSPEAQAFLDQEVTATVWHGTRRKEPIEELKKNGFCSYTHEQAIQWLQEASVKLAEKGRAGPIISKKLDKRKASILYEIKEPRRGKFSVTGIEEAACGEPERLTSGWADRNPEFMWDYLCYQVKPGQVNEILTDMFGEPIKVKLRVKVQVRQLLGPQDIHLDQKCFKPEEIVSIEKCPPKAKGAK